MVIQQQARNPEGGLRRHRIDFAREDEFGLFPTDPEFLAYSDTIQEISWAPDVVNEEQRGIGDPDIKHFVRGPESHEVTLTYDLKQWFTENGGTALDASYDAFARNVDHLMENSHVYVSREDKEAIAAQNTVSGNTSRGTRIYTVGRGGIADEVTISGDPSDSQPISIELTYMFQNVRTYQIDQPTEATSLNIVSSSADDTTQSVTIEDEGAATAETVTLNGTTPVSTTATFADIDAVEIEQETVGDVSVAINTGTSTSPSSGDILVIVPGADTYWGIEGDLGIPALGAGTRQDPSTLNSYELFIGDVISRDTQPFPHEIQSVEMAISNNVESVERVEAFGLALYPGNRDIEFETTMYGETTSHDLLINNLQTIERDLEWEMTGGSIQVQNAVLTDPGERAAETGQAVMSVDNTFMGTGITITESV